MTFLALLTFLYLSVAFIDQNTLSDYKINIFYQKSFECSHIFFLLAKLIFSKAVT